MSRAKDVAELAAVLAIESREELSSMSRRAYAAKYGDEYSPPGAALVASDALALLRIGAGVKRWAERACNGEGRRLYRSGRVEWVWDETDDATKEKRDSSAIAKASEIAARYGASVTIGGDPRGYVLRLVLASGRTNTMARDGCGVA